MPCRLMIFAMPLRYAADDAALDIFARFRHR